MQLRTKPVDKSAGIMSGRRADKVELSRESREVQAVTKVIAETPDVRADVVGAASKPQLDAGEYRISGRDVARKMLARSLADRLR